MSSPAPWDHGEVIAPAATGGHESMAIHQQGSMLMSLAHIITRIDEIVSESRPCILPKEHSRTGPGCGWVWVSHS